MRLNSKMILFVSIAASLVAFMAAVNAMGSMGKGKTARPVVTVIHDMAAGQTLTDKDLRLIIPDHTVDPGIVFFSVEKAAGRSVRNPLRRGQVLTSFDLSDKSDLVSLQLDGDSRMFTLPFPSSSAVLGFLKEGTRVDILFTDPSKAYETKTIMKNVRVLKVTAPDKNSSADKSTSFVSIAVAPDASETLAYAVRKGKIDLSVRSSADPSKSEEYMRLSELTGLKKMFTAPLFNRNEIEVIKGTKRSTIRL